MRPGTLLARPDGTVVMVVMNDRRRYVTIRQARAAILALAVSNHGVAGAARALGEHRKTVQRWRKRDAKS